MKKLSIIWLSVQTLYMQYQYNPCNTTKVDFEKMYKMYKLSGGKKRI